MIKFGHMEKRDLLKAWVLSSTAFALAMVGLDYALVLAIPLALLTAGVGIILHELAHKITASHFGYHAEFRSFDKMLLIGNLLAVFGFIFLAPGAVFFGGTSVDWKKAGLVAAAGPAVNVVLSLLFLPLLLTSGITQAIGMYGFRINAWLAMFNMLPFMGLDGEKILSSRPALFWPMIIVAGLLVFASFVV